MSGVGLRSVVRAAALVGLLVLASYGSPADARIGGGQSYSSGSQSSSSSSSGSSYRSSASSRSGSSSSPPSSSSSVDESAGSSSSNGGIWDILPSLLLSVFGVLGVFALVFLFIHHKVAAAAPYASSTAAPPPPRPQRNIATQMKRLDATFSETVFVEWATLMFARVQEARARKDFDAVALFLSAGLQQHLRQARDEGKPLKDLVGLAIGSARIEGLRRPQHEDVVELDVSFRASYTAEFDDGRTQAFWVDELWTFSRGPKVTSRAPENVERQGCPACGSPVERSSLGRCPHCQASLAPGESDWCVSARRVRERRQIPPVLTGVVEEVGTDLPTIFQPGVASRLQALSTLSPTRFQERVRHAFFALQKGWSEANLEAIRPFETDALFGQHRFWVEEYVRQGLRNKLDDVALTQTEVVKVDEDLYFDAITCRLRAHARDYTVRLSDHKVVGGSGGARRLWTEYWTFVRRRGAKEAPDDVTCPSCMAPLQVAQTGVCSFCQTKLTRGDFDWVLCRIEQDEEYQG